MMAILDLGSQTIVQGPTLFNIHVDIRTRTYVTCLEQIPPPTQVNILLFQETHFLTGLRPPFRASFVMLEKPKMPWTILTLSELLVT